MNKNSMHLVDIDKKIGKKIILKKVNFNVECGKVIGLVGPNGAGKTTLLKIICGLVIPDSGVVDIKNDIKKGVMIDRTCSYEHLSGYKNMLILANMNDVADGERISLLLDDVGLKHVKNKKVSSYSFGMKQRLGLAFALLSNPNLLILDEPTNGLDYNGMIEFRNIVNQFVGNSENTVILSSHLLDEMIKICDELVFIKDGEIVQKIDISKNKYSKDIEKEYIKIFGVKKC
ncbi:ABC transporter ATP-binding protein [Gemella cuniculi]|uniref:ABC transporter ATP-binding protein n=1 Tax=Gemella cuniculi TaxID=150240 RepID=UPI0003F78646|nr:ABC transporter ATP-binding protein [Gemella cuniculi]